mmetsp:Transcript_123119/g.348888  ORF Transcript_123119/g.348888 Transcript_123119/m.348888 type:complete len:253 (+) Transcript_123119:128-886(+)
MNFCCSNRGICNEHHNDFAEDTIEMVSPHGLKGFLSHYDLLGKHKVRGTDLRCARDQIQDDIFRDTFWCCYLYYGGCGCLGPLNKGCCLQIGEVCCCAGTCKSATCCDGDGLLAATIKCCCALWHSEIPPSNTPGCGVCNFMCGGNLDRDPHELDGNPNEQEELELLRTTCWCFFCYCFGFGCNSPGGDDPCCKVEGKLCCIWSNLETDTCCDDGWIESTTKVCCCVLDASYPAGKTPGCGCCGVLYWGNLN